MHVRLVNQSKHACAYQCSIPLHIEDTQFDIVFIVGTKKCRIVLCVLYPFRIVYILHGGVLMMYDSGIVCCTLLGL